MIGLHWDLLASDKASPAFGRLAGVIDKAALASERMSTAQLEADRIANRLKIAELQVAAATERHAAASTSASASISRQAGAEIGLIRANQGLAEAQAASAAAAVKTGRAHTVASKAATAGAAINRKLTLPVIALAAVSVNEAMKYQKSMTLIGTITDQTAGQMASTSKGLLEVAKSTGTGLHDLSEGLYTVEKGGYRGAQALAITKAAAQGAKAENTDLATTTNALTSVMASYGKKLSDPVAAMNMMIKASGLSKTTMQDFAGSLSNVVPVASSLGIGFDQVGAAIATMTQHGESAQHATDNLRNLITNLAGQNNVASASLQQLGVNTVDLSKNLGKRGLTGSLDIVMAAINKHGKDGQIVTSAFKQAATATASLKTELESMPKTLQTNSRAFDAGKMSYKDYLAYAKSLGGQQYAMAKQFLGTESTAKGFNNQLKSGNSNVRTLASTLQKSLGGVTGMNVALQLSGESADRFHTYVDEIGKSAKATQGDVLGWGNTQNTLAVKLDKAKASLQVMAVELGTALIPAVSKIVDWVGKAVHWFDQLSGTDKKMVLWSIGIMAALGPILSIGTNLALAGRGIGTFAGGVGTRLGLLARQSEGSAARIGVAMRRATGALAGAGVGYMVGSLAGGSIGGAGGKAVGALGGAAAGALTGAAIGGPWGAALGGVAGGIAGLVGAWNNEGDAAAKAAEAAKQALIVQKQHVDALFQSLQQVGGAYGDVYKAEVSKNLSDNGALAAARREHLKPGTATAAAMGDGGAIAQIRNTVSKLMGVGGSNLANLNKQQLADYKALSKVLNDTGNEVGKAEQKYQDFEAETGKTLVANNLLRGGFKNLSKEVVAHSTALTTSNDSTIASSGVARRNTEVIKENLTQTGEAAKYQLAHKKSLQEVAVAYANQARGMVSNLTALHFNRDEVMKLVSSYTKMPRSVLTTLLKTGTKPADIQAILSKYGLIPTQKSTNVRVVDDASDPLNGIRTELDRINDKTITVTVQRQNGKAVSRTTGAMGGVGGVTARADGGMVRGPGTGTSDEVPIWASNGEFVTRERMTRKHRGLLEAINNDKLPAYAKGGVVGEVHKDGKGYIYGGKYYVTKAGADKARAQDAYNASHTQKAASGVYRVGRGYGFEGQYYGTAKDANSARSDSMHQAAASARYHSPDQRATVASDTNAYRTAVRSGDINDTRSAYATLYADARAAGASRKALDALSKSQKTVIADLQRRAVATARVTKVTEYLTDLQSKAADLRTSVQGAFKSGFDITQSAPQMFNDVATGGTAGGILKSITAYADKAAGYRTLLTTLAKKGLNTTLLQQLAEAGPTTEAFNAATALGAATPAELSGINTQYSRINTAGTGAGSDVATAVFGSKISAAQALLNGYSPKNNPAMGAAVKALSTQLFGAGAQSGAGLVQGLLGQQKAAGNAASKLGAQVAASLKKSLGIHSPSAVTRELGLFTGAGFVLGLQDSVRHVARASDDLGAAVTPGAAPTGDTSGGGGGVTINHTWNITEVGNPYDTAAKVARRVAMSGP